MIQRFLTHTWFWLIPPLRAPVRHTDALSSAAQSENHRASMDREWACNTGGRRCPHPDAWQSPQGQVDAGPPQVHHPAAAAARKSGESTDLPCLEQAVGIQKYPAIGIHEPAGSAVSGGTSNPQEHERRLNRVEMVQDTFTQERAMKLLAIGLLVAMTSVTLVRADLSLPPPKGKKFVAVKHAVKLDKDITGYVFFTRPLGLRNGSFEKIELTADKAVTLSGGGKFGLQLLAVPAAVVKKYATENELLAALTDKMEGVASARFDRTGLLPEKDERKELTVEHVITGFDAKKGIQMKEYGDASKAPDKEESASAPAGISGVIGGLAATAAFVTGGLWLARRRRIV